MTFSSSTVYPEVDFMKTTRSPELLLSLSVTRVMSPSSHDLLALCKMRAEQKKLRDQVG